ncbi:unnamed protein product [Dovyalis caffra]|uniref:Uncharacterized protein n=1 Tax=Dovyalis caffra TaxID=77055 RepID=A0AAV1RRZ1_9ROSI|nr:unnamed protein product [Dovyalis caffra]
MGEKVLRRDAFRLDFSGAQKVVHNILPPHLVGGGGGGPLALPSPTFIPRFHHHDVKDKSLCPPPPTCPTTTSTCLPITREAKYPP